MTDAANDPRFDTSDAAALKRGWRLADAWLAALLALVGIAGRAWPQRLALPRARHLSALRTVRRLEALLRRLTLAMATQVRWPDAAPRAPERAVDARPLARQVILLSPDRLGLARHWRPEPEPPAAQAAAPEASEALPLSGRKPVAPTISLTEFWPGDGPLFSDHPIPARQGRNGCIPGAGPRIRSFDAPFIPTPEPVHIAHGPSDQRLLKRLAALKAVMADPDRMVRRMARWLARRAPPRDRAHRPWPINIVLPQCPDDADMRHALALIQDIARARLRRRDSG